MGGGTRLSEALAVAALLLGAGPALAQKPPAARVQSPVEAVAQDAAVYAARYGVPLDEAMRRLRAQEESVPATDRIRTEFASRLAGITLEHRPAFRISVLLTGDTPVPTRTIAAGGMQIPVMFVTGATATRERVAAALRANQSAIRAMMPRPPGLGIDERTGRLVVTMPGSAVERMGPDLPSRLEEMTGVPVEVRASDRETNLAVEGGSRVEGIDPASGRRHACTTGFVVSDGARTGIATAAHCPDDLSYVDPQRGRIPLGFVGQWGWGYRDVQIHLAEEALKPLFYADAAKTLARPVTSWRNRASTRAGDVVCHRGESTGYSCAEVELTEFAPPGDLCGGQCEPLWVTVAGPSCRGGDSGGPVFSGTVAFGLLKGGSYRADGTCNHYYYMSTDYLPDNWRLLHQ